MSDWYYIQLQIKETALAVSFFYLIKNNFPSVCIVSYLE